MGDLGSRKPLAAWLVAAAILCSAVARADVLLDDTRTVTAGPAPVEQSLTVGQTESLDVDVVDAAFPAPLAALRVVVTQGGTLVQPPLVAAGRITFTASAGLAYVIRVVGRPASGSYSGNAGVTVTRSADPAPRTPLLQFVASFAVLSPDTLTTVLNEQLNIPQAGDYTVSLVD